MTLAPKDRARADELLADRATQGLSPDGEAELRALLGDALEQETDAFERAATAVALAALSRPEALPPSLARSIEARALAPHAASLAGTNVVALPPLRKRSSMLPWLAAAACLALAAASWLLRPEPPIETARTIELALPPATSFVPPVDDARAAREALLKAPDAIVIPWAPTKDAAGAGASGDVVWSASEQRGYMRFRGLAANDPKSVQYQLWIFDKHRDERFPVDGGVFDVAAGDGDVVVPIKKSLAVGKATLFAVTAEKPGGVVVSKRERIVVTAAAKG